MMVPRWIYPLILWRLASFGQFLPTFCFNCWFQKQTWSHFAGKPLPQGHDRCKYGVLNAMNDHRGVVKCAQYGDSYFVLKDVPLSTKTLELWFKFWPPKASRNLRKVLKTTAKRIKPSDQTVELIVGFFDVFFLDAFG